MRKRSPIVEHLATLINEAVADPPGPRTTGGGSSTSPPQEIEPIDWNHDGVPDPFFIPVPGGGHVIINPDYYHLWQQPTHGGHDQVQGNPNYIETDPTVTFPYRQPGSRDNPINP
jgi:hypothetical protein